MQAACFELQLAAPNGYVPVGSAYQLGEGSNLTPTQLKRVYVVTFVARVPGSALARCQWHPEFGPTVPPADVSATYAAALHKASPVDE